MNLIDRCLYFLLSLFFDYRDIVIEGRLYLRRYFLRGRGTDSQWFLHNVRLADAGRELHDHPWPFTTWVLWGGYVEQTLFFASCGLGKLVEYTMHTIGRRHSYPAAHAHRIDRVSGSTWTLMHAGKACRTWGFWLEKDYGAAWVSWREYLGLPSSTPDMPEDAHP